MGNLAYDPASDRLLHTANGLALSEGCCCDNTGIIHVCGDINDCVNFCDTSKASTQARADGCACPCGKKDYPTNYRVHLKLKFNTNKIISTNLGLSHGPPFPDSINYPGWFYLSGDTDIDTDECDFTETSLRADYYYSDGMSAGGTDFTPITWGNVARDIASRLHIGRCGGDEPNYNPDPRRRYVSEFFAFGGFDGSQGSLARTPDIDQWGTGHPEITAPSFDRCTGGPIRLIIQPVYERADSGGIHYEWQSTPFLTYATLEIEPRCDECDGQLVARYYRTASVCGKTIEIWLSIWTGVDEIYELHHYVLTGGFSSWSGSDNDDNPATISFDVSTAPEDAKCCQEFNPNDCPCPVGDFGDNECNGCWTTELQDGHGHTLRFWSTGSCPAAGTLRFVSGYGPGDSPIDNNARYADVVGMIFGFSTDCP